ncbi:MAG: alpha/beta hydrolase [Planctomycetia bacterium]|nr:alpha/beta hydrolase [Planctomycetia bacterium]
MMTKMNARAWAKFPGAVACFVNLAAWDLLLRYSILSLTAAFAVMALAASGVAGNDLEIRRDVEFARPSGVSLKLDAYLHKSAGPHPAIVFVHGGGFVAGDKADYSHDLFDPLVDAAFSSFSVNYRLAPTHPFPAPTDDVESAIAWIKQNAVPLRIDPARLVLAGPSAGGLLVSYVGARHRAENSIAAVVSMFGEHDLLLRVSEDPCCVDGRAIARPKGGCISGGLAALLGFAEVTPAREARLKEASAVTHVHQDMPPYLLIHGTRDFGVPFEQSVSMHEAMRTVGADVTLLPVVGGGHGNWSKSQWDGVRRVLTDWLTHRVTGP